MKIAILSIMYPPDVGGAETYAYELSRALGKLGHKVDVFVATTDPISEDIDSLKNVSVTRLFKRKKIPVVETVYYSIKSRLAVNFGSYDVVHGTLMPASTVLLTPGIGMDNSTIIVTSHGTSYAELMSHEPQSVTDMILKYGLHPVNVIMDKIAGEVADRIIAISDHAEQELRETYSFNDKVEFIPHGVNTDWFYPRSDLHPAVSRERLSILTVGRLGSRKNVDLALRGIATLIRQYGKNVEFLIAGTGRHEQRLREIAVSQGINNQVNFLGHVSDGKLPLLYSSADIFALTSNYEGFGLVLLEAMACGTPVIGTDVGGISTVIDHGRTGVLIKPNPCAFAHATEYISSQEESLAHMSCEAVKYAERHPWTRVAQEVEDIYFKCVDSNQVS
jgi:glycosyltransferase involved in cell wall biosynthesis